MTSDLGINVGKNQRISFFQM